MKNEKVMEVHLKVLSNYFLLTDAEFENCVVAKGDVKLQLQLSPEREKVILSKENYDSMQESIK